MNSFKKNDLSVLHKTFFFLFSRTSIELTKPTVVNTPTEKVENPKPLESKIKSDQKDAGELKWTNSNNWSF